VRDGGVDGTDAKGRTVIVARRAFARSRGRALGRRVDGARWMEDVERDAASDD